MTVRGHQGIILDKFMGLWDRNDKDSTPRDHFTDCENIKFIANSSFGTRDGVGISQDVLVPLSDIKRIYNYPTPKGDTLIVLVKNIAGDGEIYHVVNSTLVYGPLLTITGMTDFAFVAYAGRGYISPFSSQPNTTSPPLTAMLATLAAGTDINTGVHKYAATVVTATGETNLSPITTITTNIVAIADPLIAPTISNIGSVANSNALVPGGTYRWKFVYSVNGTASLLTLPGPASGPFIVTNTSVQIGLQTPSTFPVTVILVGIYRTINGGATYYEELPHPTGFNFPTVIPTVAGGAYLPVGIIDDATLVTHPVAPVVNNTTTGNVDLSNITLLPVPIGLTDFRRIYRTPANSDQFKLLTTFTHLDVSTTFHDNIADSGLGANAPTTNTAILPGDTVERGLQGEFLYVYSGDGTAARKAAGLPLTGTMLVANGAPGHTDAGLHLFGFVSETDTGYLSPPGLLTQFTTIGTNSVSFGSVDVSSDPHVIRRHLVATIKITGFNGDLTGYTYFFVPNATIENNTDLFLNNISFYDADLLDDASHLFDNFTEIPAGAVLGLYHNRLMLGATYTDISIYLVSNPGEPEAISKINGLLIFPLDGHPVTNGKEYRDIFYGFKATKTVAWVDNSDVPSSWPMTFIDNALGTTVHGIAVILDSGSSSADLLIIANYKGINLFNGTFQSPELTWKIQNFWFNQDRTLFNKLQLVNDPISQSIYIVLPDRRLLVGNYLLGMDYKNIRWAPWSFFPGINTIAITAISEIILGSDLV